jgi:hypothetical protein
MFALDAREAPSRHRPRPERKEAAYFENEELPRLFAELSDASSKTLCSVALKRGMRQANCLLFAGVTSTWSRRSLESVGAIQEAS